MSQYKSCDGVRELGPVSEHLPEAFQWPVGHFYFFEPDERGVRDLFMVLPSAADRGAVCRISVKEGPQCQAAWGWNGDLDRPTVTPSIFHDPDHPTSSKAWHGFLTDGKFVGC